MVDPITDTAKSPIALIDPVRDAYGYSTVPAQPARIRKYFPAFPLFIDQNVS